MSKLMMIDYTFRNREESEKYWNEIHSGRVYPRPQRVVLTLVGVIVFTPIEVVRDMVIVALGMIATIGSLILWATNPIEKKQTKANAEEES